MAAVTGVLKERDGRLNGFAKRGSTSPQFSGGPKSRFSMPPTHPPSLAHSPGPDGSQSYDNTALLWFLADGFTARWPGCISTVSLGSDQRDWAAADLESRRSPVRLIRISPHRITEFSTTACAGWRWWADPLAECRGARVSVRTGRRYGRFPGPAGHGLIGQLEARVWRSHPG
jgi:hypothetical protein